MKCQDKPCLIGNFIGHTDEVKDELLCFEIQFNAHFLKII